jgi:hypothetical protein
MIMGGWIIYNRYIGGYRANEGAAHRFTRNIMQARVFPSRKAAEKAAHQNESIVPLERIALRTA